MLELEEARQRIRSAINPLPTESVPLTSAWGRFVAAEVLAPIPLPAFDNSAMDGYAVCSRDVSDASTEKPAVLRVIGRVAAGNTFAGKVNSGEAVRLFTGSALPDGADAVVMQEDTRPHPDDSDLVLVIDGVKAWENLRFRGEDVKAGSVVVQSGERLSAGHLGLLGACGLEKILVHRQPVVGLLATGSELVTLGQSLAPGQIYESNRVMLAPLLVRSGAVPKVMPLVPDTLEATRAALESAFTECDAVVTSGGVSVGEFDFIKAAFESLGGKLDFWRVSIKPGKPFVFGQWGGKYLFGLPGNPVSAAVTFLVLVQPALRHWQAATVIESATTYGILDETLANPGDRRHFMRVQIDERGGVRSAGKQASHRLGSLAAANGIVDVAPATTLAKGTTVPVIRFED